MNPPTLDGDGPGRAFRHYIVATAQHSLAQAKLAEPVLSLPVRDQALHILSYALKLEDAWPVTRELLLTLAPKLEQMGHRDDWIPYLETALERSEQLGDNEATAYIRLQLGILAQYRARYAEANEHLTYSADGFATLGNGPKQAEALNRLAYIARLERHYAHAQTLVTQALSLLEDGEPGQAFSYFVLGWIANETEDYTQAVKHFHLAFHLAERAGDLRSCALYLGNAGTALRKLGRFTEAIECYSASIVRFGDLQDWVQQAVMRMNLGNVYLLQQQPQNALELYQLAAPRFQAVQDEMNLALLIMNLGIAYRELQHFAEAEQSLQSAIERWQQLKNAYCLVNSWDELGLVYLQQGHYGQANTAFQQGIDHLSQMQDQPGYASLYESLVHHISQLA